MNDERPDDNGPPPPPAPLPTGRRAHPLALGCAGVSTFAGASIVFLVVGMATMDNSRLLGFLIPLAIAGSVIWLFVHRTRSGSPAPLLGAAAVGLSIATIVYGLCYASMGNFRIQ